MFLSLKMRMPSALLQKMQAIVNSSMIFSPST